MQKLELNPEYIPQLFKENLQDPNVVFVLPTDTVMHSWLDWIVMHPELSGTDAVAFEHFIVWDNFKRQYLSARQQDKNAVPTLLRKLFVTDLIQKNAAKPKAERLQSIINPEDEFATNAVSFTDWICKNLTSLHYWKKRLDNHLEEYGELDSEDKDYLYLYEQYKAFLEKYSLFEPTWIDNITFPETKTKFLFLYPELLQDFEDYADLFSALNNIIIYNVPKDLPAPKAYLFPDSRKELRTVMLEIIELVTSKKADWSEIALSIPDIDTYRPYIEREFNLYQIPYVIKAGNSLTKNCAGRIFREIYNCYSENFSFNSIRALVLDECVPWKKELEEVKEALIREGNRMRCMCSPYDKDIWLSALTSKINRLQKAPEAEAELKYFSDIKEFYEKLKKCINHFFSEDYHTFEQIRRSWMEFKSLFLEADSEFSEEANNILSRCIKELEEIIQIEKDYEVCGLQIQNPFDFFLQVIDSKSYTPQTNKTGVQIYKYKLTAAAWFKFQFVIDASQKNLEIDNKRLTFLNSTKRAKLHLVEEDSKINSTEAYMKLYAKPTESTDENFVHFTAATNSFADFAIPHSLLNYTKENLPNLDKLDYILQERAFINNGAETTLQPVTAFQKEMFNNWLMSKMEHTQPAVNPLIQKRALLKTNESDHFQISARGDLEKFFPCPRLWIFSTLLKFKEDSLDTQLMKNYDMGNLNHKILELVLSLYKGKTLPCFYEDEAIFKQNQEGNLTDVTEQLQNEIENVIKNAILGVKDFRDSPLVIRTLQDQSEKIKNTIYEFLKFFLKPFTDSGFGGCTVHELEGSYSVTKNNYNFFGRIDCLLKTPENDFVIIDFKNTESSIPAAGKIHVDDNGIITDFQMPLYYKLISEGTGNDIHSAYYYSVSDRKKRVVIDPSVKNSTFEDYEGTLSVIEDYADLFVTVIKNNELYPQTSAISTDKRNVLYYKDCVDCPYKTICRTTYTVAGKQISKKGAQND